MSDIKQLCGAWDVCSDNCANSKKLCGVWDVCSLESLAGADDVCSNSNTSESALKTADPGRQCNISVAPSGSSNNLAATGNVTEGANAEGIDCFVSEPSAAPGSRQKHKTSAPSKSWMSSLSDRFEGSLTSQGKLTTIVSPGRKIKSPRLSLWNIWRSCGCFSPSAPNVHPLLVESDAVADCYRFVRLEYMLSLGVPMPRCQDLPIEAFCTPRSCDLLVAISHGWLHQMHQDPHGKKKDVLNELLLEVQRRARHQGVSQVCVFFDFLCLPQRPWLPAQMPRTKTQQVAFEQAMQLLHLVFLHADVVLHLDLRQPLDEEDDSTCLARQVNISDLQFMQFGNQVQVIDAPRDTFGLSTFDVLLDVDGDEIESVEQIEARQQRSEEAVVTYKKFPYGVPNTLPCGRRGWVFLERFISMVVAAMLDGKSARSVVLSNSPEVLEEILLGADRLRQAAYASHADDQMTTASTEDLTKRSLGKALAEAKRQLKEKEFSAASVDKHLHKLSARKTDRDIVSGLMDHMVQNLLEHWLNVAAKQRSRKESMLGQVGDHALGWTSFHILKHLQERATSWRGFSEEMQAEVLKCQKNSVLPLVGIVAFPVCAVLLIYGMRYQAPNDGFFGNSFFNFYFWPVGVTFCTFFWPQWVATTMKQKGVEVSFVRSVCFCIWLGSWLIGVPYMISFIAHWYPVPFQPVIAAVALVINIPTTWFCIPAVRRLLPEVRWAFLWSFFGVVAVLIIFGLCYPVFTAFFKKATGWQHVGMVFLFLASRMLFDKIGELLSRKLGYDALPPIIFLGIYAYELYMCVMLGSVQQVSLILVMLFVDVLENAYYAYCLSVAIADHPEMSNSARERIISCIMSVLLVREFAEVLVPIQFMTILTVLNFSDAKRFNDMVAHLSVIDYWSMMRWLLIDLGVELGTFIVILAKLRCTGAAPLRALKGALLVHLSYYTLLPLLALTFFLSLQHSHAGCDFEFKFTWLTTDNATWVAGLVWSP